MLRARVIATLALALAATVSLAGCDSQRSDQPSPQPASAEPTATLATAPANPEALAAWIAEHHGEEAWPAAIERIVYATKLGSPVIELHLAGSIAEARPHAQAALLALREGELGLDTWVEVWASGRQFAGAGLGTPRAREYPPSPRDVTELHAWLLDAFGPSEGRPSEPWLDAIEQVELGESAAKRPVIRVDTDLPIDEPRSADRAALIIVAIGRARPTFAGEIEVWYADERGLLSGSTDTYDPYVY